MENLSSSWEARTLSRRNNDPEGGRLRRLNHVSSYGTARADEDSVVVSSGHSNVTAVLLPILSVSLASNRTSPILFELVGRL